LIINGASPFARASDGWTERVQRTGTGILNLANSVQSTVAAYPTSLSFGVGDGTLGGAATGDFNQLTLTNVGTVADTFSVSSIPYDGAPQVQFGTDSTGATAGNTLAVNIAAGQSRTIYVFWTTIHRLPPGEYQGLVSVQAGKVSASALVPYWYGVPPYIPFSLFELNGLPGSDTVGTVENLYVRVTDSIGYPITDDQTLAFQGQVLSGGGSIALSKTLYFPNLRLITFTLGPTAGTNSFAFTFGKLAPVGATIAGAAKTGANAVPAAAGEAIPRGVHGELAVIQ